MADMIGQKRPREEGPADLRDNVKYRPRMDPLEHEATLDEMIPLESVSEEQWNQWYLRYRDQNEFIQSIKAQKDSDNITKTINNTFVLEFKKWLQGRSRWNINMKPDGETPCTPWGPQNLFFLPGVVPYLRSFIDKKVAYQLKLVMLYLRGPTDLNEAFIYYKYLVRGDQIVMENGYLDDTLEYIPWGNTFKYLTNYDTTNPVPTKYGEYPDNKNAAEYDKQMADFYDQAANDQPDKIMAALTADNVMTADQAKSVYQHYVNTLGAKDLKPYSPADFARITAAIALLGAYTGSNVELANIAKMTSRYLNKGLFPAEVRKFFERFDPRYEDYTEYEEEAPEEEGEGADEAPGDEDEDMDVVDLDPEERRYDMIQYMDDYPEAVRQAIRDSARDNNSYDRAWNAMVKEVERQYSPGDFINQSYNAVMLMGDLKLIREQYKARVNGYDSPYLYMKDERLQRKVDEQMLISRLPENTKQQFIDRTRAIDNNERWSDAKKNAEMADVYRTMYWYMTNMTRVNEQPSESKDVPVLQPRQPGPLLRGVMKERNARRIVQEDIKTESAVAELRELMVKHLPGKGEIPMIDLEAGDMESNPPGYGWEEYDPMDAREAREEFGKVVQNMANAVARLEVHNEKAAREQAKKLEELGKEMKKDYNAMTRAQNAEIARMQEENKRSETENNLKLQEIMKKSASKTEETQKALQKRMSELQDMLATATKETQATVFRQMQELQKDVTGSSEATRAAVSAQMDALQRDMNVKFELEWKQMQHVMAGVQRTHDLASLAEEETNKNLQILDGLREVANNLQPIAARAPPTRLEITNIAHGQRTQIDDIEQRTGTHETYKTKIHVAREVAEKYMEALGAANMTVADSVIQEYIYGLLASNAPIDIMLALGAYNTREEAQEYYARVSSEQLRKDLMQLFNTRIIRSEPVSGQLQLKAPPQKQSSPKRTPAKPSAPPVTQSHPPPKQPLPTGKAVLQSSTPKQPLSTGKAALRSKEVAAELAEQERKEIIADLGTEFVTMGRMIQDKSHTLIRKDLDALIANYDEEEQDAFKVMSKSLRDIVGTYGANMADAHLETLATEKVLNAAAVDFDESMVNFLKYYRGVGNTRNQSKEQVYPFIRRYSGVAKKAQLEAIRLFKMKERTHTQTARMNSLRDFVSEYRLNINTVIKLSGRHYDHKVNGPIKAIEQDWTKFILQQP